MCAAPSAPLESAERPYDDASAAAIAKPTMGPSWTILLARSATSLAFLLALHCSSRHARAAAAAEAAAAARRDDLRPAEKAPMSGWLSRQPQALGGKRKMY